jgi:hypothetical protein
LPLLFFVLKRRKLVDKRTINLRGFDEITNLFHRVEDFHSDVCQIGEKDRYPFRPREVFKRNNRVSAARDEDDETVRRALALSVVCGCRHFGFNRIGFHKFNGLRESELHIFVISLPLIFGFLLAFPIKNSALQNLRERSSLIQRRSKF